MRRKASLPEDIEHRLTTLGTVLDGRVAVRFAYVFGSAGRGALRPLSDIDVAVYLDNAVDPAYVTQVSEYRDLTVERYRADWKTQRIVERTLQIAIEACLDVARILRKNLEDFRRFETEALGWL